MVLSHEGFKDEKGNASYYNKAYYICRAGRLVPKDKNGKYMEYAKPTDAFGYMIDMFRKLTPSHIVFNGVPGSIMQENSLNANVGDNRMMRSLEEGFSTCQEKL